MAELAVTGNWWQLNVNVNREGVALKMIPFIGRVFYLETVRWRGSTRCPCDRTACPSVVCQTILNHGQGRGRTVP